MWRRHPSSGLIRRFGPEFSCSDDSGDGPQGQGRLPTSMSVTYTRASIYQGLPDQGVLDQVDEIVDSRLGYSSMQSMSAALGHWDIVRQRYGWNRIIYTARGCDAWGQACDLGGLHGKRDGVRFGVNFKLCVGITSVAEISTPGGRPTHSSNKRFFSQPISDRESSLRGIRSWHKTWVHCGTPDRVTTD